MLRGNVNAAIRLVTEQAKGGIIPLDPDVLETLKQKHPNAETADPDVLIHGCMPDLHPISFAGITADSIRQAALHTKGSAGPSGGDAEQWRHMCTSFHLISSDLCAALARVTQHLATETVCPEALEGLLANRLIPLNKCPGIRPIGVGECHRRIIAKTIIRHLRSDKQKATGPIQVCAGFESGCEAAIHAMTKIFEDEYSEGILLVDADNAVNRLNRAAALWNLQFTCPTLHIFAKNCYQVPTRLYVTGGAELISAEGTTQGDPLAMPLYALSLMPLIREMDGITPQAWYADDSQAAGKLLNLRRLWERLLLRGHSFGYFQNAEKTILVVKSSAKDEALKCFASTGIKIADGARDLGAAIGSESFVHGYVSDKVVSFCASMNILSDIAESSPQAAHSAFVHGFRHKWQFIQRCIPNISNAFVSLETIIRQKLIPALLGGQLVNDKERTLLSLAGRLGGFAIDNPVES
jgi:hypothetical protein